MDVSTAPNQRRDPLPRMKDGQRGDSQASKVQLVQEKGERHDVEIMANMVQHRVIKDFSTCARQANTVIIVPRRATGKDKLNADVGACRYNLEVLKGQQCHTQRRILHKRCHIWLME